MFTKHEVFVYDTAVEPLSSGSKIIKNNETFNINELHKNLNDGNFVVVRNHVGDYSDATEWQMFIITDKVTAENGYVDSYIMSHYGRSKTGVTNRKYLISFSAFGENATLKASYYSS